MRVLDGSKSSIISIHALLAESDDNTASRIAAENDFYPRSPCGERLSPIDVPQYQILISIHALLAESDHFDNYNLHCVEISIHALLAESDL